MNAAPTRAQEEYLEALTEAHGRYATEVRGLFDSLRSVSDDLGDEGLPGLLVPTP